MEAEVQEYYREYKHGIISMLAFSGLWPEKSGKPKYVRFSLFGLTLLVESIMVCGLCNFTVNSHKMNAVVAGAAVLISFIYLIAKLVSIMVFEDDVLYLNRNLAYFFERDLEVVEYRPFLLAYYRSFYRLYKTHIYYFSAIVIIGMSIPIAAAFHGKSATIYPIRPPFHYEPGGARHWMIFAIEMLAGAYAVTATIGYDCLFGLYALHLVGEMRLLTHRFRTLKPGKNYRTELKHCVDKHALLVDTKNVMQRLFGFMSVLLAVTCAFIVCAQIFTLTMNKNLPTFKIAFLIDYIIAKLYQAYMYAWFGNRITVESEICLNSIYDCDWPGSGDLRLMNDILIIQSQSPMDFETMGIMKVGLDMFSKVVKTSIRYFFLLKTVEEKLSH